MPLQRIKTEFIGIYYRYGKIENCRMESRIAASISVTKGRTDSRPMKR